MNRKDFMALVLQATEDTNDILDRAVRDDAHPAYVDPAANTVLHAADELVFALVRYRAEHQIPQR